jgi:hypothetical protein
MSFLSTSLRLLAASAAISAISGCATLNANEAPPPTAAAFGPVARPDVATICVFHDGPDLFTLEALDNGTLMGMSGRDAYFCYWATPGNHTIVSRHTGTKGQAEVRLPVEAGRRYWLQQSLSSLDPSDYKLLPVDSLVTLDETSARKLFGEDPGEYSGPASMGLAR